MRFAHLFDETHDGDVMNGVDILLQVLLFAHESDRGGDALRQLERMEVLLQPAIQLL